MAEMIRPHRLMPIVACLGLSASCASPDPAQVATGSVLRGIVETVGLSIEGTSSRIVVIEEEDGCAVSFNTTSRTEVVLRGESRSLVDLRTGTPVEVWSATEFTDRCPPIATADFISIRTQARSR